MPQIRFRGVKINYVTTVRKPLIDELTEIVSCPRDYFTVEHVDSSFIGDDGLTEGYPFVDVFWFDRGQEVQDRVAETITKYVHKQGYPDVDIIFHKLNEKQYYENGKHF